MTAGRSSQARATRIGPLVVVALVMLALAGGGVYLSLTDRTPREEPQSLPSFDPPPITETGFLNTSGDVQYVGNAACAECHRRNGRLDWEALGYAGDPMAGPTQTAAAEPGP